MGILYRLIFFLLGLIAFIGSSILTLPNFIGKPIEANILSVDSKIVTESTNGRPVYEQTKRGYWTPKQKTQYSCKYSFSVNGKEYIGIDTNDTRAYRVNGKLRLKYIPSYPKFHNSLSTGRAILIIVVGWLLGILLLRSAITGNMVGIHIGGSKHFGPKLPPNSNQIQLAANTAQFSPQMASMSQQVPLTQAVVQPNQYAFCPNCGVPIVDGANFCQKCGKQRPSLLTSQSSVNPPVYQQTITPQPASLVQQVNSQHINYQATSVKVGFSDVIYDSRFTFRARRNRAIAYGCAVFIIPMPFIGFVSYSYFTNEMNIDEALMVGAGVSAIFLIFYIVYFIYKAFQRPWKGVIVDKYSEERRDSRGSNSLEQGRSYNWYTAYILKVQTDSGKIKELEYRNIEDYYFNYFDVGDRIKYHPQIEFYEKYDKSRDTHIICPLCARVNPITDSLCKCGAPLIK